MLPALLNKSITVEKGTQDTNNVMPTEPVYEQYMETKANVYVRQGRAVFGESEEFEYTTEFTVWYTTLSKEINNKYRILFNGDYYKIREVIEVVERNTLKFITTRYGN